jgi:hypothetical protein
MLLRPNGRGVYYGIQHALESSFRRAIIECLSVNLTPTCTVLAVVRFIRKVSGARRRHEVNATIGTIVSIIEEGGPPRCSWPSDYLVLSS